MKTSAMSNPFQKSQGRRISAMSSLNSVAPPYEYTPFIKPLMPLWS